MSGNTWEPVIPETPEQYSAVQQLALAGFYYVNFELSGPQNIKPDCSMILEYAKEALEAFGGK